MPQHAAVPDDFDLSFTQAIPRHMVHRAAVAEVFLTDAVPVTVDGEPDANRFLVAAQWPRDHAMYHPDCAGRSDPLLFAETLRQAMVYVAHRFQAIPMSHRFIGFDMDFEIGDPERLRVGAVPLEAVLDLRWAWEESSRPPKRYGFRVEVDLLLGGHRCGRGSLRVAAVDDKRYGLLRGRGGVRGGATDARPGEVADLPRVPAASVGRLRAKDSVLTRGEKDGQWWLRLDLDHAILFDHPSDHAPLMGLLEGFRQLGHLLVHGEDERGDGRPAALVGLRTDCLTFGELDVPIGLVVRETGEDAEEPWVSRLAIDAVQDGTVVATSTSRWLLPHADGDADGADGDADGADGDADGGADGDADGGVVAAVPRQRLVHRPDSPAASS